jgi:hypothetical protein
VERAATTLTRSVAAGTRAGDPTIAPWPLLLLVPIGTVLTVGAATSLPAWLVTRAPTETTGSGPAQLGVVGEVSHSVMNGPRSRPVRSFSQAM